MRARDSIIIVVSLVAAAALFYASGAQLDYINNQRQEMDLVANEPLENAPPSLAFATVAMGAFRGLVVDLLWMRADKLKEEGQYFDAKQLASWITTLQPRFADVWVFQAWNMAYNISVAIPATQPDQRWRWVKNGYELLRDEGLEKNPKSISIYRELARIFQHKLGDVGDDAHKYYKLQLAAAMTPLLGSIDNDMAPTDDAFYDALVDAPELWSEIAADPNVAPFIKALQEADPAFTSEGAFVQEYLTLRQAPSRFGAPVQEVLDFYAGKPALKAFDIFAKAYQLRHTWKMDPALMRATNLKYGPIDFAHPGKHLPLDWRHPDSHALYWASKGLQVATDIKDPDLELVRINTERLVTHSLQNLFRYGIIRIFEGPVDPPPGSDTSDETVVWHRRDIFLAPDLRMFYPYNDALLGLLDEYANEGRLESFENAHRNMLKNAVLTFYESGFKAEAQKIYQDLRTRYPRPEFPPDLDQYASSRFKEEFDDLSILDAREQLISLLSAAYYLYAIGQDSEAAGKENMAQQIYDYYQLRHGSIDVEENRVGLPPMAEMKYVALSLFFTSGAYPRYLCNDLLARIEVEKPELYKELLRIDSELKKQQQQQEQAP